METQTLETQANSPAPPLRLTLSRDHALRAIGAAVKIGEAIAGQRIRERWELDQARSEKLEWMQRTADVLKRLFNSDRVAEWCNDWVGRILPEYSDLGAFIEQFEEEMEHRLGRLRKIRKKVEEVPETNPTIIRGIRSADQPPESSPNQTESPPETDMPVASVQRPPTQVTTPTPAPPEQRCLLICREDNPQARETINRFAAQLDMPLASLVAPAPEELDHARAGFVILMAGQQGLDPFELGFCMGRLGNKRICILTAPDAPAPDTHGLPAFNLDQSDAWQLPLARQLRRGGMNVDLNRLV